MAEATGTDERYVREWLEHQAVTGILEVDDGGFRIPPGHDEVLLDRDSVNYMAAFARMMVGMAQPLPQVLEAFRTGEGVPYADFPPDFVEGQGDMNRKARLTDKRAGADARRADRARRPAGCGRTS